MTAYRVVLVNTVTGVIDATGEGHGDVRVGVRGGDNDLAVSVPPFHKLIRLCTDDVIEAPLEAIAAGRATPADKTLVGLPTPEEVEYDPATGWLRAKARPTWEDATGKTKAAMVDDLVAGGAARGIAEQYVAALKGEYEAFDPLERVFPEGTTWDDIFSAGSGRGRT